MATIRSIEDMDFKIIVIRLDETPYPRHLHYPLQTQHVVDLTSVKDIDTELLRIADYIDKHESTSSGSEVYVDRGADTDQLYLIKKGG